MLFGNAETLSSSLDYSLSEELPTDTLINCVNVQSVDVGSVLSDGFKLYLVLAVNEDDDQLVIASELRPYKDAVPPGYMEMESYLVSLDASLVSRDDMVGMTSFGYEPQVAIAAADRLRAMFSA